MEGVWEGEAPGERLGVRVLEGVRLGLSEGVSLGVGVPLELSELVWLALAPTERAGVGVGEAVAERVGVRVPLGEPVLDLLGVRVLEPVLDAEEPTERDEVGVRVVVLELELLGFSLGLRGVWLPLLVLVCVGVAEIEGVVLGLAPVDSVPVGVPVMLGVRVLEDEREGVPVRLGVREGLAPGASVPVRKGAGAGGGGAAPALGARVPLRAALAPKLGAKLAPALAA